MVKAIDQDAKQLADALIDGTKIVITTLQKFRLCCVGCYATAGAESQEKASDEERAQAKTWQDAIAARRYGDRGRGHSSQTGETARELKAFWAPRAQPGPRRGLDRRCQRRR